MAPPAAGAAAAPVRGSAGHARGTGTVLSGEIHSVARDLRERGLVASAGSLVAQFRDDASATLLDLLIEAHPDHDDGGKPASTHTSKLATHLAVYVDGSGVQSMARLTVYGAPRKPVGIVSAVATRESRRGRGLAATTVARLVRDFAGTPLRLHVDPTNAPAVALYESLGFLPCESRDRGKRRGTGTHMHMHMHMHRPAGPAGPADKRKI
eukprot:jgi/Tetstr1/447173/TSEL_034610.t1